MGQTLIEEINNLEKYPRIREYIRLLDNHPKIYDFHTFIDLCQHEYCVEFCIYFYFSYENVEIFRVNNEHHIFRYNGLYYDSLNLKGTDTINKMERFIGKPITSVVSLDGHIPKYYSFVFKELKNEESYK